MTGRDVARQRDTAGPAPARSRPAAAPGGLAGRVLALQQAAGNGAVAAMFARPLTVSREPAVDAPSQQFDAIRSAEAIREAFHGSVFSEDEKTALTEIRRSPLQVKAICEAYKDLTHRALVDEFRDYVDSAQLKEALSYLRPALNLEKRLELSIDPHLFGLFSTENEGAMLAELKRATADELREAAKPDTAVRRLLSNRLNAAEYYAACKLLDPTNLLEAAIAYIPQVASIFGDDEAAAYDVILDLPAAQRKELWERRSAVFKFMGEAERAAAQRMCTTTEAEALRERMRIATKGVGTENESVRKLLAHTADAARRERALTAALAAGRDLEGNALTAESRAAIEAQLLELGGDATLLDLEHQRGAGGALDEKSFLGMVHDDVSAAEFDAFTEQLGVDRFERAKQKVLDALDGWDDEGSVYDAFDKLVGQVAPPTMPAAELSPEARAAAQQTATRELRAALLADQDVKNAIAENLDDEERAKVATLASVDTYQIAVQQLNDAYEGFDTDERRIYLILTGMSDADRQRLRNDQPPIYRRLIFPPSALSEKERGMARVAIETGRIPTDLALGNAMGDAWDTTDEELAFDTLERLTPEERAEYRLGYYLFKDGTLDPPQGPTQEAELKKRQAARDRFAALYARLDSELDADDLDKALDLLVGPVTLADYATEQGRLIAARLLKERVDARGGHRDSDWVSPAAMDTVSETGGISDAAHARFLEAYNSAIADGKISASELAMLMSFATEQAGAHQEYVAATDTVGQVAGTVAAVLVGIVITVASDGALGPVAAEMIKSAGGAALVGGVAGAAARLGIQEAVGGSHFDVLSKEGGVTAVTGFVDAALPGLTQGMAASMAGRFGTLVGLGGDALAAEAATGVVVASNAAIREAGKKLVVGAFQEAIQGVIAGAAGDLVLTAADEKTWNQSVSAVLTTLGTAIVRGGGIGAATGALMGGALHALTAVVGVTRVQGLVRTLETAGIDGKRLAGLPLASVRALGEVDTFLAAGKLEEAAQLLASLKSGNLDAAEIEGMWRALAARRTAAQLEEVLPGWTVSATRQAEKAVLAFATTLPDHTFVVTGPRVRLNDTIELDTEYLVHLQATKPDDFDKLLAATKALGGKKFAELDEATQTMIESLSATRGLRVRFLYQVEDELDGWLADIERADAIRAQFPDFAADQRVLAPARRAAVVNGRTRLWETFEGYREAWKADGLRVAFDWAMSAKPANVAELAERIEFFLTDLNRKVEALNDDFRAASRAARDKDADGAARKALGLPATGTIKDAARAKLLVAAQSGDGTAGVTRSYEAVAANVGPHVGVNVVDVAKPEAEMVAAVREQSPKMRQTSTAAYHSYKHPEMPDPLPAGIPAAAGPEEKYFALCEHVVKNGAAGPLTPMPLGGRSVTFTLRLPPAPAAGHDYSAIVHISRRGEATLATMFRTKPR